MRYNALPRLGRVACVCGLLAAAITACAPAGSSSTQNPQNAQGSFSAAPTQVHPTAQSAPAVPPGAGTGGSAGSDGSTATISQITINWNLFFGPATSAGGRIQLLQNGSQFASSVSAFAASPLAAALTSKVDSVTMTSATKATVRYDLSARGRPIARGTSGNAVFQNGTWKVGDDAFCALLKEAKGAGQSLPVPAACGMTG